MQYLLDTHTFLWFINGDSELSKNAKKIIENQDLKYISVATFWEIAIKISIGKLQIDMPFQELKLHVVRNGFELLPITFEHTNHLVTLPMPHKDPFDRIIIAQAYCDNLTVISRDSNFEKYKVKMSW